MLRHTEFDIIIIGTGIAGLFAAFKASEFARVCLICKDMLDDTGTRLAQGGIAAALAEEDSPEQHMQDTVRAGGGLCDSEAVSTMVHEAPKRLQELLSLGVPFDCEGGNLSRAREGAHSRPRILHAGGDATGRCIQNQLQQTLQGNKNITVRENTFVNELLKSSNGEVCGVRTITGEVIKASAVILAAGGTGQIFSRTTNANFATGDGVAMAYQAGATLVDMEFIQFHPTAFAGKHEQDTFLISEAVRGEGAVLRNAHGRKFMDKYHEFAELGPRDVVSRAMLDQMELHGSRHVFLDLTHQEKSYIAKRFPTLYGKAAENGLDPSQEWLPVAPAAHYAMGGVSTGLDGESTLPGLFACGEVAGTGVHGANRLASNSLLEGLVFSARAVEKIQRGKGYHHCLLEKNSGKRTRVILTAKEGVRIRKYLRELNFRKSGIIRTEEGLSQVLTFTERYKELITAEPGDRATAELQSMMLVSVLLARAALARKESRGAHYRSDYPVLNEKFSCRFYQSLRSTGKAGWYGNIAL